MTHIQTRKQDLLRISESLLDLQQRFSTLKDFHDGASTKELSAELELFRREFGKKSARRASLWEQYTDLKRREEDAASKVNGSFKELGIEKAKLKQLENEINVLSRQRQEAEVSLSRSEKEIGLKFKQKEATAAINSDLRHRASEMAIQLQDVRVAAAQKQQQVDDMEGQIKLLKADNEKLEAQIRSLDVQTSEMAMLVEKAARKNTSLRETKMMITNCIESLRVEIQTKETAFLDAQKHRRALETNVSQMEMELSLLRQRESELIETHRTSQMKHQTLLSETRQLQEACAERMKLINARKDIVSSLMQQHDALDGNIIACHRSADEQTSKLSQHENELRTLEEQIENKRHDCEIKTEIHRQMLQANEQRQQQQATIEQQLKKAQEELQNRVELQDELSKAISNLQLQQQAEQEQAKRLPPPAQPQHKVVTGRRTNKDTNVKHSTKLRLKKSPNLKRVYPPIEIHEYPVATQNHANQCVAPEGPPLLEDADQDATSLTRNENIWDIDDILDMDV